MFNRFLTILFLVLSICANAQFGQPKFNTTTTPPPPPPPGTTNLVVPAIADNTEYAPRYGGVSRWNLESGAKIVPNLNETAFYFRLTWLDCEESLSQGNYAKLWQGRMRARVTEALNNGQLFAFGIMQFYPEVCSSGGFNSGVFYGSPSRCSSYPEYVHNAMQGNGNSDFNDFQDGTSWIPAYNNPTWQARWLALHQAIMNWMDTAVITPTSGPRVGQAINVKNALAYVDIRGHGSYGEWHNCCVGTNQTTGGDLSNLANWPGVVLSITTPNAEEGCFNGNSTIVTYGKYPTPQTMKNTIDAQVDTYSPYPCVVIINALDGWRFCNTKIAPEVAAYICTKRNAAGIPIGFRRDQWGDASSYYNDITVNNNQTFGGIGPFKDSIMIRYKTTYFTGEMPGYSNCNTSDVCRNGVTFGWLPNQASVFRPTWVGNGNFGGNAPTNQSSVDSILKFYRLNGPRVVVRGGTMTTTLQAGAAFNVTLSMQNSGNSVIHRAWTTQIILKNSGGTTVFTGTHTFQVKDFLPAAAANYSTNFTLSGATPGTGYNLYIKLIDPLNYAQPFYLGNTGRIDPAGEYLLRPNITVVAGP
jgi:hypothetical protein